MIRIAALLVPLLLVGCAGTTPSPASPTSITLGIGESAMLDDGSRLTYLRLVNDSRCAPNVQCTWTGDAEILLRRQSPRSPAQDTALHTHPAAGGSTGATLGPFHITLETLGRGIAPRATLRVDRN